METIRETLSSIQRSNFLLNESAQILNTCVNKNTLLDDKLRNSINFALSIIKLADFCLKDDTEKINQFLGKTYDLPWEFQFNQKDKHIECTIKDNFGREKLINLIFQIGDAIETYHTTLIRFKIPKHCLNARDQIKKIMEGK
ncbi:MPN534 family protein [Mycoplasmoides genitalium]